ncbi:MAG: hypothetical protein KAT28_05195 [Candidatus Aenigmarchaeota archaeon]|nr:hypothetical protein [Candidatus Aenigmarchaeota archaeon]
MGCNKILEKSRMKNIKNRREFIRFYANYVKSHKNEIWSRQQTNFINSLLKTANQDVELFKRTHPKDFRK